MVCCHPNRNMEGRGRYVYPHTHENCDCGGFKSHGITQFKRGEQEKMNDETAKEVGWDKVDESDFIRIFYREIPKYNIE